MKKILSLVLFFVLSLGLFSGLGLSAGAEEATLQISLHEEEKSVDTEFGPVYLGCRVTATASGMLRLTEEE